LGFRRVESETWPPSVAFGNKFILTYAAPIQGDCLLVWAPWPSDHKAPDSGELLRWIGSLRVKLFRVET